MEELITRVLSGEATQQERERLDQWRRECPPNERTYQEFLQAWNLAGASDFHRPAHSPPPLDLILRQAERRRSQAIPLGAKQQHRIRTWRWLVPAAAAAVVMLVAGAGLTSRWIGPTWSHSTGPDETKTITLADGTIVRLAPSSQLSGRGADQRATSLTGRAFFAVASDSLRPFTVRTSAGEAVVLGTRFDLLTTNETLRLVVIEGRVGLTAAGETVQVEPGEISNVVVGAPPDEPNPVDASQLLDWPGGILLFQSTPLSQVAAEVQAHFGIPVVIRDTTLARRSVTAWFDDEPFEDVINTICQVIGARCVLDDGVEVHP